MVLSGGLLLCRPYCPEAKPTGALHRSENERLRGRPVRDALFCLEPQGLKPSAAPAKPSIELHLGFFHRDFPQAGFIRHSGGKFLRRESAGLQPKFGDVLRDRLLRRREVGQYRHQIRKYCEYHKAQHDQPDERPGGTEPRRCETKLSSPRRFHPH
jgi:hypothetical protein